MFTGTMQKDPISQIAKKILGVCRKRQPATVITATEFFPIREPGTDGIPEYIINYVF